MCADLPNWGIAEVQGPAKRLVLDANQVLEHAAIWTGGKTSPTPSQWQQGRIGLYHCWRARRIRTQVHSNDKLLQVVRMRCVPTLIQCLCVRAWQWGCMLLPTFLLFHWCHGPTNPCHQM